MITLFTSEAISKGARSGTIRTPDGLLDVTLGNPMEKGHRETRSQSRAVFGGRVFRLLPRRLGQRGQEARHTGQGFHGSGTGEFDRG